MDPAHESGGVSGMAKGLRGGINEGGAIPPSDFGADTAAANGASGKNGFHEVHELKLEDREWS